MTFFPDGVLFFPVTPFSRRGGVDAGALREHVQSRLSHGAAGVFAACGTGEFHAMTTSEINEVVTTAVEAVNGEVPVVAGAGGTLGNAIETARMATDAGADALLLMPPYLVKGTQAGVVAWVRAIADEAGIPVIVYHRDAARLTREAMIDLLEDERVLGIKDGVGDVGLMQQITAWADTRARPAVFFNGQLTAEVSQSAYRAIGVDRYSSAVFAMHPPIALAFHAALRDGDDARRALLIREFFTPFVNLRDETAGFAVSLIKAGVRLRGHDVGPVRPPLVEPSSDQLRRLSELLTRADELVTGA